MKDQVAALRWVNKNISNLGGDPENITKFGESAGGVCVSYQLISSMSKGLFRRAIFKVVLLYALGLELINLVKERWP